MASVSLSCAVYESCTSPFSVQARSILSRFTEITFQFSELLAAAAFEQYVRLRSLMLWIGVAAEQCPPAEAIQG